MKTLNTIKLSILLAIGASFTACKKDISPEELALQSAKVYYEQLLEGDYAAFVAGTYRQDSISDAYREELEANAKMFLAHAKDQHKGVDSIVAQKINGDTAYLKVCFADSTKEEIVVPMVNINGIWMMR